MTQNHYIFSRRRSSHGLPSSAPTPAKPLDERKLNAAWKVPEAFNSKRLHWLVMTEGAGWKLRNQDGRDPSQPM
jgi:hypothetical protein